MVSENGHLLFLKIHFSSHISSERTQNGNSVLFGNNKLKRGKYKMRERDVRENTKPREELSVLSLLKLYTRLIRIKIV